MAILNEIQEQANSSNTATEQANMISFIQNSFVSRTIKHQNPIWKFISSFANKVGKLMSKSYSDKFLSDLVDVINWKWILEEQIKQQPYYLDVVYWKNWVIEKIKIVFEWEQAFSLIFAKEQEETIWEVKDEVKALMEEWELVPAV